MPIPIQKVEGQYGSQACIILLEEIVQPQFAIVLSSPLEKKRIFRGNFPIYCSRAFADWFKISSLSLISLHMSSPDLISMLKVSEKEVYELGKKVILVFTKS